MNDMVIERNKRTNALVILYLRYHHKRGDVDLGRHAQLLAGAED